MTQLSDPDTLPVLVAYRRGDLHCEDAQTQARFATLDAALDWAFDSTANGDLSVCAIYEHDNLRYDQDEFNEYFVARL